MRLQAGMPDRLVCLAGESCADGFDAAIFHEDGPYCSVVRGVVVDNRSFFNENLHSERIAQKYGFLIN